MIKKRGTKGFAILVAVLMAFVMMPIGFGVSHAATGTVTKPLDFAKDTKSRSGDGWSWDEATHELYLENFQMDLTKYSKDYSAAIRLPAGEGGAKIVLNGTNEITLKGSARTAIVGKGDLYIEGDRLNINANGKTNGIWADKSLQINQVTAMGVSAFDYCLGAKETMTLFDTYLDLSVLGTSTDRKAIKSAILAENRSKADEALMITGSDITVVAGGLGCSGIEVDERQFVMENSSYIQNTPETAKAASGFVINNGSASIHNSEINIDVDTDRNNTDGPLFFVGAMDLNDPAPTPSTS